MQLNVIGGIEIAGELDYDEELEIEMQGDFERITCWLTKSQAEELADHIQKVIRENNNDH